VVFQENVAASSGGALYVAGSKASVKVLGGSRFKNNKAKGGKGGDIYMEYDVDYLSLMIENTSIINAIHNQNSMSLEGVNLSMQNVNIERSYAEAKNTSGGAIDCSNCPQVQMVNTSIKNSQASSGGAVYITGLTDSQLNCTSLIANSTFFNNKALRESGGALSIINVSRMVLSNNTFNLNSASDRGGALYTSCDTLDCNMTIEDSNIFINNKAGSSGGAIQWQNVAPQLLIDITKSSTDI
jgi:predicted outer membrane repeat protein